MHHPLRRPLTERQRGCGSTARCSNTHPRRGLKGWGGCECVGPPPPPPHHEATDALQSSVTFTSDCVCPRNVTSPSRSKGAVEGSSPGPLSSILWRSVAPHDSLGFASDARTFAATVSNFKPLASDSEVHRLREEGGAGGWGGRKVIVARALV